MNIQLKTGDSLFEPMSRNVGQIIRITDHPDGKLVIIRWHVDDHLPHETEHFYKKVVRSIRNGEMEYTPVA